MSHRAHVTLSDEQHARLREESRLTGLSFAELVRRAVDRCYFDRPATEDRLEALERSAGAWKDRDLDGAEYVDRLRPGMANRLAKAEPPY